MKYLDTWGIPLTTQIRHLCNVATKRKEADRYYLHQKYRQQNITRPML